MMKYIQLVACLLSLPAFSTGPPTATQECPNQGEPLVCYTAAYNAPAVIAINPKERKLGSPNVNLFVDAAFTYWWAGEDGLKLASTGVLNASRRFLTTNTDTLTQSFGYKPGFKIGTGVVGHQEWTVLAEYTWFRGKNTKNSGAPLSGTSSTASVITTVAASGNNVWVVDDWFLQNPPTASALMGSEISSTWKLHLDLIDLVAGRPFYQGRHLTVSPFGGLRSALIRQFMDVYVTESTLFTLPAIPVTTQPVASRNQSKSWSIGPVGGCETKCLLPMGFRLEGDCAASLLYTQYTTVKHSEDVAFVGYSAGPYTASLYHYNCVRPMAEMGLGLGWGMYLCDRNYHLDFLASYDFKVFWAQNMMRKLMDDNLARTSASPGDLFLHGFSFTGRFDF
ncbi:MAG: hypothetical protein KBC64_07610 [Simkaniaceae bacterium]|nr:hypothetical protein [Simkaniaceae bacterium]